jgi:4'-phosphopantetheinyl transferase EntD
MTPSDLDSLMKDLPQLIAPAVATGGFIPDLQGGLLAAEEKFVGSAVKKRREEFVAGRCAARAALKMLGITPNAILQGASGEPLWPEGFTGSITHSNCLAFAVVTRKCNLRTVGIDVEVVGRVARKLWRMTFSEAEREAISAMPDEILAASIAFSAKEAFMKAQFSISGKMLGLKSMRVEFVRDGELALARLDNATAFNTVPCECTLRYAMAGDHVFVFCAF